MSSNSEESSSSSSIPDTKSKGKKGKKKQPVSNSAEDDLPDYIEPKTDGKKTWYENHKTHTTHWSVEEALEADAAANAGGGGGGGGGDDPTDRKVLSTADVDNLPDVGIGCDVPTCIGTVVFAPCVACGSIIEVDQNTEIVLTKWGEYRETIKEPGLHWRNCIGVTSYKISTKEKAYDMPNQKMLDSTGTPIMVSGVVTYRIVHSKRSVLLVDRAEHVAMVQASAVLKQIVGQYPYEARDGEPSLKTEMEEFEEKFITALQKKIVNTGIVVSGFSLNELSYAPEIAQGMLKRQQAGALVSAKETVVDGGVDIATMAVEKLEDHGINLSDEAKAALVSNLLVVICSDGGVQPTVSV